MVWTNNFSIISLLLCTLLRWVSDQTEGKIDDIIKGSDISPNTKFVLVSSVYLKGKWKNPFSPRLTKKRNFNLAGRTVSFCGYHIADNEQTAYIQSFSMIGRDNTLANSFYEIIVHIFINLWPILFVNLELPKLVSIWFALLY